MAAKKYSIYPLIDWADVAARRKRQAAAQQAPANTGNAGKE